MRFKEDAYSPNQSQKRRGAQDQRQSFPMQRNGSSMSGYSQQSSRQSQSRQDTRQSAKQQPYVNMNQTNSSRSPNSRGRGSTRNSHVSHGTSTLHNSSRNPRASQFFSVANEQDGHEVDVHKDMMRNTYQISIGKSSFDYNLCLSTQETKKLASCYQTLSSSQIELLRQIIRMKSSAQCATKSFQKKAISMDVSFVATKLVRGAPINCEYSPIKILPKLAI